MLVRNSIMCCVLGLVIFIFLAQPGQRRIIYVDDDATGTNNGSSWEHAYKYLQDALADANSAPKPIDIWVAEGTYRPDENAENPTGTGDRSATFQLLSNMAIYGGFPSGGGFWQSRDPETHTTILSGDLNGDDIEVADPCDLAIEPSRLENSYHVVTNKGVDTISLLDGFTIKGGNANHLWADDPQLSDPLGCGGGMYSFSGRPTLVRCTFSDNSATSGGAICNCSDSDLTLTDCILGANLSRGKAVYYGDGGGGGAIYNEGWIALTNCIISGNVALIYHYSAPGTRLHSGGGNGGGIYGRASLTNCTLIGNRAETGGGGLYGQSGHFVNSKFHSNIAKGWRGGGGIFIVGSGGSNLELDGCTFSENSARCGGGIYARATYHYDRLTATDCTFSGNSSTGESSYDGGGGMYINWDGALLRECRFNSNSGRYGGGIRCSGSSLIFEKCEFNQNSAYKGGGMYNYGSPTLTNCTFSKNYDSGMHTSGNPILFNCVFIGNSASGISNDDANSTLINCTFTGNSRGVSNYKSTLMLINCILWGGRHGEIYLQGTSSSSIRYCDIEGGQEGVYLDTGFCELYWGPGNINSDPLFVDVDGADNTLGTEDDNVRLQPMSPCIDAGTNEADIGYSDPRNQMIPSVDMGLNYRRVDDVSTIDRGNGQGPIVDMGAYEFGNFPMPARLYVKQDVRDGYHYGTSWDDALAELHDALDIASCSLGTVKEIWVAAGTYIPGESGSDRMTSFTLQNDLALYGGFSGGEDTLDQRDPDTNVTILSGDLNHNDGPDFSDNDENCYHVVTGNRTTSTAVLDGFVISGGNADGDHYSGGGLLILGGAPTIRNCVISGNYSSTQASAFYITTDIPTVTNPTFSSLVLRDNFAPHDVPNIGVIEGGTVTLLGDLTLEAGWVDVWMSHFYGNGSINLDKNTLLKITGVIGTNINGPGDIEIDAGRQLIIEGDAVVNLGGGSDCNPDPNTGGHITVNGSLFVRDNASLESTNVDVKRLDIEDPNIIQYNNITLREASTGFGGELFVSGPAIIKCNNIKSQGDRYLDLDPDPSIPEEERPKISENRVTVIINEGTLGSQGTLLELRAGDYDCGGPNNPDGASGAYKVYPNSLGFTEDPSENWVLEKLIMEPNSKLNLTNRQGFEFQDPNDPNLLTDIETIYVKELVLGPNSVLNTALQTLYYERLVNPHGVKLVRDPDDPFAPLANGSRFTDIPLLGFSLGIIAMNDPAPPPHNEFDIRVRGRLTDPRDDNPPPPKESTYEGLIERLDDDPNIPADSGGVMDMRTQAPGKDSASSIAAKGAFSRAGDEDITIEFEYMFIEPHDNAEIIVYLSDKPEVDGNIIEVARIYPPHQPGLPGSSASGKFAVFSGIFSRGDLNFTRGTYVQLELRGKGARCWIDNWDPQIYCNICCDYDGLGYINIDDYYLLLAEFGLSGPSSDEDPKGCLDLVTDGHVTMDDVIAWDAIGALWHNSGKNACPWSTIDIGPGEPVIIESLMSARSVEAQDYSSGSVPLCLFGKPYQWKPFDGSNSYLYGVNPEGFYVENILDIRSGPYGRLMVDSKGKIYQITGNGGLVGSDGLVVEPKKDILFMKGCLLSSNMFSLFFIFCFFRQPLAV